MLSDPYYILEGKTPRAVSFEEYLNFDQKHGGRNWRRIAFDDLGEGVTVSTVFLMINHSFGDGPPILFETMIFGGENDQWQDRYTCYDLAELGHKRAVEIAKGPKEES